jgi:tRNA (guanine37-N1)-methyltransferase
MALWTATVLTIFPEMFPGPLGHSLAGKALRDGLWRLETVDIRDFARDKHRSVDDAPFGGGPGMVMRPDVIDAAIEAAPGAGPVLCLSPRGRPLDQARVRPVCGCSAAASRGSTSGSSRREAWRRSASATSCSRAASRRRLR